jgi:glutathione peroxidase-family protein
LTYISLLLQQIDVNGPNSHPLYKYLKKKTGGTEIGWNFFKILVVDGVPVQRYPAAVKPKDIVPDLLKYLAPGGDDSSPGGDEL